MVKKAAKTAGAKSRSSAPRRMASRKAEADGKAPTKDESVADDALTRPVEERRFPSGMTTKRANGSKSAETVGTQEGEKPLRPSQCKNFMRQRLAAEFRGIVHGFVRQAKSGSCQHVKLASELLGKTETKRPHGKGSAEKALEQLQRELNGEA